MDKTRPLVPVQQLAQGQRISVENPVLVVQARLGPGRHPLSAKGATPAPVEPLAGELDTPFHIVSGPAIQKVAFHIVQPVAIAVVDKELPR